MNELFIGIRYLWSRKRNGFASFVTLISLMGVTLGVAALIVILSVMNGFEFELRERLLSMSAHGAISHNDESISDWQPTYETILEDNDVLSVSPIISIQGMLRNNQNNQGVEINAVIPSYEDKIIDNKVRFLQGGMEALKPGLNSILLGRALARNLNVMIGDTLLLLIPSVNDYQEIEPILDRFIVRGIFEAGIQEYDSTLALVHLEDVQKLIGIDGVSELRFNSIDPMLASVISERLVSSLGKGFVGRDWTIENASYFRAIKLEKTMMSIMLLMVIGVAAFNIVASLIMVVTEKRTDIAVLRTLGMSPASIMRIFFLQGAMIGWFGTFFGVLLGVLIALNVPEWVPVIEQFFGFQIMPGDVFYVTAIPSLVILRDVIVIAVIAFLLTALATLYPANQAAKVNPAIALRYEH
ncbi:MAG: lipoprotein-releasing ABC transporter permease subunit [Woeseiaceae bacterium]|nr:lipoprotein-releasing ABC transporter permease subunit [Woeseiaceae bacterium]|tara:strand:- start:601 stop:1836 length:1236 start_codon:yes stop_codon:yes gene_type:complete